MSVHIPNLCKKGAQRASSSSSSGASAPIALGAAEVRQLLPEAVRDWAIKVGLKEKLAGILFSQEINGETLLETTAEELNRLHPEPIPFGPAKAFMKEVKRLLDAETGPQRGVVCIWIIHAQCVFRPALFRCSLSGPRSQFSFVAGSHFMLSLTSCLGLFTNT
jgi:hypothetical protein